MELDSVLIRALNNIERNIELYKFPHITESGKWITTDDGYWKGGFYVGLLWYAYAISNDNRYKNAAYNWLKKLDCRKKNRTFDLGFFYPSFVLGYKITRDATIRTRALEAADALTSLFHEKAGFVYNELTMNGKKAGRTIIDVMMELSLLWWAYEETRDKKYYNVAYIHAK